MIPNAVGRIAKIRMPSMSPELATVLATDAMFDLGEGMRSEEDLVRSAAGVTGSTLAGLAAYSAAKPLVSKLSPRLGKLAEAAPVLAGFVASLPGGWAGDRTDELIRGK